jgi:hypothetical protein
MIQTVRDWVLTLSEFIWPSGIVFVLLRLFIGMHALIDAAHTYLVLFPNSCLLNACCCGCCGCSAGMRRGLIGLYLSIFGDSISCTLRMPPRLQLVEGDDEDALLPAPPSETYCEGPHLGHRLLAYWVASMSLVRALAFAMPTVELWYATAVMYLFETLAFQYELGQHTVKRRQTRVAVTVSFVLSLLIACITQSAPFVPSI